MKNWRTTLTGAITAAGIVALNLVQNGTIDAKTIGIAAGIAALGFIAKDAGVSGTEK